VRGARLVLAALLIFCGAARGQQVGSSALTPSTAVTPQGPLTFTPAKILNPLDFGAKCDGATDDHLALTAWAAALGPGNAGVVPGDCRTSTPITFPNVSGITIEGKDGRNSRLTYIGATTTLDIYSFGGATTTNTLNIRNVEFETATMLTGGALLHIKNVSNGAIHGITAGANTNNAYTGLWLDNDAQFQIADNYYFNGSANDVLISGTTGAGSGGDIWFSGSGSMANGGIGIHIAGGVNGTNISHADVLANAQSFVVDESVVAASNKGIFVGPGAYFDIATSTSAPNVELVASTGTVQDYVTFKGVWFASSAVGQPCMQIDSGWQGYVNFQKGEVENCNTDGIKINSTTAHVNIGGTYFLQISGSAINNAAGNSNVTADSPIFAGFVGTPWSGPIRTTPAIGRTDGGSALTGTLGEQQSVSNFSGTGLASGSYANINSLTLASGYWTCFGSAYTSPNSTTTTSLVEGGFSTASASIAGYGDTNTFMNPAAIPAGVVGQNNFGPAFFSFASATTVYEVVRANFAVSTMLAGGTMHCTRTQ
jgi:hypothetical protein